MLGSLIFLSPPSLNSSMASQVYSAEKKDWSDISLFRSLNMAHHASQLPAGTDTTRLDIGRMVALWVSAFEILAHPAIGKSGTKSVFELLNSVQWEKKACRAKRYHAEVRNGVTIKNSTFFSWLYGELYRARDQFLHGNPITRKTEIVPGLPRVSLLQYAAPLYRMALTAFLGLRLQMPPYQTAQLFGERWPTT